MTACKEKHEILSQIIFSSAGRNSNTELLGHETAVFGALMSMLV
jgi:hypothetical protein